MTIQVQCYAGYRGEQEPRSFALGEQHLNIVEIADRWLAPHYRYFKVATSDGNTYVLRHDEHSGEWTLGAYRQGQE